MNGSMKKQLLERQRAHFLVRTEDELYKNVSVLANTEHRSHTSFLDDLYKSTTQYS